MVYLFPWGCFLLFMSKERNCMKYKEENIFAIYSMNIIQIVIFGNKLKFG